MKPIIKEFSVIGLFSDYNIKIKFHDNVKIIVGENGIGKTTILNMFYYTISKESQDFLRLKEYDFRSICIEFTSGTIIKFTKEAILNYLDGPRLPLEVRRLQRILPKSDMMNIIEMINNNEDIENSKYISLFNDYDINLDKLNMNLKILGNKYMEYWNIEAARKQILKETYSEIIYLPTYRRIEEDLQNLDSSDSLLKNKTSIFPNRIRFGLQDIQNRIDKITYDIKAAYRIGFSKISAEILNDMTENINIKNVEFKSFDKLKIIVDRIDDEILHADSKKKIKDYINSIDKETYKDSPYNYFLSKLMTIYQEQAEEEKKIIKFKNICNDYLFNKHFYYEESSITLTVRDNHSNKPISLNKLSSGEKQIISLFASLYLDSNNKYIILFDEPELSLSMEWQSKLLPDIYASKKCTLLMAVTHSPFVFNNDLSQYAVSLNQYCEKYNND